MEQAFLQAILEAPEDDAPRLVFADWLEENGQEERAEFIRLQCRSPSWSSRWKLSVYGFGPGTGVFTPVPKEHPPAEGAVEQQREQSERDFQRMRALEEGWGKRWLEGMPAWVKEWSFFERGFLARVSASAEVFAAQGQAVLRAAPVRFIDLEDVPGQVANLVRLPDLGTARELCLSGSALALAEVERLATSPLLSGLTELRLRLRLAPEGVGTLTSSPQLDGLRVLDFRDTLIGNRGVLALLERLGLGGTLMGPVGLAALLRSPLFAQLIEVGLDRNPLGDEGAALLA